MAIELYVFFIVDSLATIALCVALERVLRDRRRLRAVLERERVTSRVLLGPIRSLTPNDLLQLVDANRPMGQSLRRTLYDMAETLDQGRYP